MKKLLICLMGCALLLVGCANPPTSASLPTAGATAETVARTATAQPLAPTAAPTVTASPVAVGPPHVGIQVGHWRIEEHPDEMALLRKFSGAYYRGYDEWELNIVIAKAVRERLEAAGVTVDLLPSNVPVGYSADAFVSIHVDGVTGEQATTRRGWKVATPFRASLAAQALAAALSKAYQATTGLPKDREEASYNLRAYYAFANYRYWHSIAETTPAAIIEVGFITYPDDRKLIFDQPDLLAAGIAQGLLDYLAANYPLSERARAPVGPGMLRVRAKGTVLYKRASDQSTPLLNLAEGQVLVPMDTKDDWYLVFTHGGDWDLGWVRSTDVVESGEPFVPPHPRPEDH